MSLWFRDKYPDTPFRIDIAADMPLQPHQRGRLKSLHGKFSRGHPDMVIYAKTKKHCAYFIEMKTLKANLNTAHVRTQQKYHDILRSQCYKVDIIKGYDAIIKSIDKYMRKVKLCIK